VKALQPFFLLVGKNIWFDSLVVGICQTVIIWASDQYVSMLVFWVVTPCGFIGRYQCSGGTYCLHFQRWRWRQYVSPKLGIYIWVHRDEDEDSMFLWNITYLLPSSPHGITPQNNNIHLHRCENFKSDKSVYQPFNFNIISLYLWNSICI
jgi:hypothetical protein